mmetsp:Transcript_16848/g.46071  ORF Transcript_16848/g.46071 Transcript_16848/m.46071 type:complete len:336 (+) Transcript_16848:204-1211(+)|eukprot:CAMPEP_0117512466 /NCGR_PEP_ID=MMETSP0784-20121206/29046_1 /TAXON_ID=39447 /ORGANISM="" /LENGTH=335 /DNA_ID=CAMNT_0005308187 /DNA_START=219 /DNA_END=1226 /DNA_ORIENTATION=+
MASLSVIVAVVTSADIAPARAADSAAPQCKRFDKIYASGKELCENMWNDAFVYEEDEANAYTMWFWDKTNPNDKISRDLGLLTGDHGVCHLDYYHKDTPGPEPKEFTECHPWKDNACCAHQTVVNATTLKESYGPEYHWDRCGPLSPECERFFVQEACFYECDPNAGLFRKWNATEYDARCDRYAQEYDEAFAAANKCDHNAWQMHKMPIKASYCDAWFTACAANLFCSADDGDYFTCAAHYEAFDVAAELEQKQKELQQKQAALERLEAEKNELNKSDGMDPGILVLIIVLSFVAVLAVGGGACLIMREKSGKPVFAKQVDESARGGTSYGNAT